MRLSFLHGPDGSGSTRSERASQCAWYGVPFRQWEFCLTSGIIGTFHVFDDASNTTPGEQTVNSKLKYDQSGKEPVILVPQPTDDPNDPLVSNIQIYMS